MKRCFFLLMFLAASLQSMAQSAAVDPRVVVAEVEGRMDDGKWVLPAITISQLLSTPHLSINIPEMKVISFTFSLLPNGGEFLGPYSVEGPALPERIIEAVRNGAGRSGKIYIEDIKATDPGNAVRTLNAVTLRYTN